MDQKTIVYNKYHKSTNMTYSELLQWSKALCSHKASLDRSPIVRNLRLLKKSKSMWTQRDIRDANKTIAFVPRMKHVPNGQIVKGCNLSKREISLRNWGYNSKKR